MGWFFASLPLLLDPTLPNKALFDGLDYISSLIAHFGGLFRECIPTLSTSSSPGDDPA